jgi:hypothetical protein
VEEEKRGERRKIRGGEAETVRRGEEEEDE